MSMIGNFLAVSREQLDDLIDEPDLVPEFLYPQDNSQPAGKHLHIDKAWHGIHFLLTGEVEGGDLPWSQAIMGGAPLGDADVGYGPALYLRPEEVRTVAAALRQLTVADLRARYAPHAMSGIYPDIWERDGEEAFAYLLAHYQALVKFYEDAATENLAVIQYLN